MSVVLIVAAVGGVAVLLLVTGVVALVTMAAEADRAAVLDAE